MTKKKLLILSIFNCTLVLALAVIVIGSFATSSYGWHASNNKTDSVGMNVGVNENSFNANFEYLQYDVKQESYLISSDLSNIDFNPYDLVFRSRNRYTPVVIRIGISGSELQSSGQVTVTIRRDTTKPATEIINNKIYMSRFCTSVMRFTPYIGDYYSSTTSTQYTNIDTDSHFNACRALVGDDASGSQVFTTVNRTGNAIDSIVKDNSISFSFAYTSSNIVNDTLYVFIYITYDEGYNGSAYNGLTGVYQSTSGLTTIGDTSVEFVNDLSSIKVSKG